MGIAIVAGILLLVAGLSGLVVWEEIKAFVIGNISDNAAIQTVFLILIIVASLGGIAVIIGGILIGTDRMSGGKLLLTLGVGLGMIGFILSLIVGIQQGSLTIGGFLSIGAIGLVLSIAARLMVEEVGPARKTRS
jgi:hypothetical protein